MFKKIINQLFRGSENINYNEAIKLVNNNKAIIIDVKSEEEYKEFHVKNAINIPLDKIEKRIEEVIKSKDSVIILYCKSGKRAKTARKLLKVKGYTNIYVMYV